MVTMKVEKEMEDIRMTCVGLGNTILDMKKTQGVDMRKEAIDYFVERFVGVDE